MVLTLVLSGVRAQVLGLFKFKGLLSINFKANFYYNSY